MELGVERFEEAAGAVEERGLGLRRVEEGFERVAGIADRRGLELGEMPGEGAEVGDKPGVGLGAEEMGVAAGLGDKGEVVPVKVGKRAGRAVPAAASHSGVRHPFSSSSETTSSS
jgi:hypothetical protein